MSLETIVVLRKGVLTVDLHFYIKNNISPFLLIDFLNERKKDFSET